MRDVMLRFPNAEVLVDFMVFKDREFPSVHIISVGPSFTAAEAESKKGRKTARKSSGKRQWTKAEESQVLPLTHEEFLLRKNELAASLGRSLSSVEGRWYSHSENAPRNREDS